MCKSNKFSCKNIQIPPVFNIIPCLLGEEVTENDTVR